jgi:two-component system OmpR family sensor kinase
MKGLVRRMPLRIRLVLLMTVLVFTALSAVAVAATVSLRSDLVNHLDDQLTSTMQRPFGDSSGNMRHQGPPPIDNAYQDPNSLYQPAVAEAVYRTVLYPGDYYDLNQTSYIAKAGGTEATQTRPTLPSYDVLAAKVGKPFDLAPSGAGTTWRVLVIKAQGPLGEQLRLAAYSYDGVNEPVGQLIELEVVIGVIVLVALGLVAYFMVRSSLRPLVAVENTAEAIAAGDLTRRVPEADPRTEVGGLASALNVMLGQIETAFDERRASEEEARTSEARMRRFIADASHELRTPLTSIRGFAELYRQNGGDDPEVNKIIGRIEHHATRMGVLVDDLLLLARLDQQRPLERRPVDLLTLAADAVMDARVVGDDHVLRLRTQGADDEDVEPPVVLGDEVRIRQVIGNLVTNALRHTPAGTEVTVSVGTSEASAFVEVADNGPGMSDDDARRVFERFYRTDPSRARSHGGTGLGLSIVAALVAAHGGTVTLETAEGRGARFRVRLPLAGAQQALAVEAS